MFFICVQGFFLSIFGIGWRQAGGNQRRLSSYLLSLQSHTNQSNGLDKFRLSLAPVRGGWVAEAGAGAEARWRERERERERERVSE